MDSLAVYLVQRASGLDPAENRAALDVVGQIAADRAHPDLVVFPEVYARDFGKPGSDVGPYAEPLDGPFVTRLHELAATHGTTLVAGMFESSDDPERPYNTLVVVDRTGAISLVFLGRREIAGIEVGSLLTAEGMVGVHQARLAIVNPSYQLLGASAS